jgi:hypothetical protein
VERASNQRARGARVESARFGVLDVVVLGRPVVSGLV